MSEHKPKTQAPAEPKKFGWMAEYTSENDLLAAARKIRDSGYTKTDAYTPFPVHGIDEALGIKPTVLPWIVLCAGLTGLTIAFSMQMWMNAYDYPYIISGKPYASVPAFIPVMFELTVLFSAFTAFFSMVGLNKLPRFSNPVFTNPKFDRATNDRFFLYVDSSDKYYNNQAVQELLAGTHPHSLDEVIEDTTPNKLPRVIWMTMLVLITASLSPLMILLGMRNSTSDNPRFHVFFDMDFQPKKKPQQTTTIFADGRIMRPQVPGTVASGQLPENEAYSLGYDPSLMAIAKMPSEVLVSSTGSIANQEGEEEAPPQEGEAVPPVGEDASQEGEPATQDGEAAADNAETTPEVTAETLSGETTEPAQEESKPEDATTEPAPVAEATQAGQSDAAAATTPDPNAAPVDDDPLAKIPFLTSLPIEANEKNMALGKQKFEIFCAACHGFAGEGNGLVAKRASELAQGDWLQPTSLHMDNIRKMPVGRLFYTISNGKGKMAGYGASITPEERWAITLYVRALQEARNADIESLTPEEKQELAGINLKARPNSVTSN